MRVFVHAQDRPRTHARQWPQAVAPGQDDAVAGSEPGHAGAQRLDRAGALVAEHQRKRHRPLAVDAVQVAVADAAGAVADAHLARAGIVELERSTRSGSWGAERTAAATVMGASSQNAWVLVVNSRSSRNGLSVRAPVMTSTSSSLPPGPAITPWPL